VDLSRKGFDKLSPAGPEVWQQASGTGAPLSTGWAELVEAFPAPLYTQAKREGFDRLSLVGCGGCDLPAALPPIA
jgi:hypothetical protein